MNSNSLLLTHIIPKITNNDYIFILMNTNNPKPSALPTLNGYKYPYEINNQRKWQCDKNIHGYKCEKDKVTASQPKYKYTYYKESPENQFTSKGSMYNDSLKPHERGAQPLLKVDSPTYQLPSFKKKVPSEQVSFQQIADSVQYTISYKPQPLSQQTKPSNNFEAQTQEILFLKDKLVETHNKLMKQLQQRNKLSEQVQSLYGQLSKQRQQNKKLKTDNESLKQSITIKQNQNQQMTNSHQKFQQLQSRYKDELKKTNKLKQDNQSMRNKMLQAIMVRNNLQQQNNQIKQKLTTIDQHTIKYQMEIKSKDQAIQYLTKQLQTIRKKYHQCEEQCEHRAEEIHQYNHLATERQKTLNTLQTQLRRQKQKTSSLTTDLANFQIQHKLLLKKHTQLQDYRFQPKSQTYCYENKKSHNQKNIHDQLQKLTNQLNHMTIMYKQKQKQIDKLKKKPNIDGDKKKKNLQITKQFVNKLEKQQSKLDHNTSNIHSKSKQNGSQHSKCPKRQATAKKQNRSPAHREGPKNYQDNSQDNSHTTHSNLRYQDEKGKYMDTLSQVGHLQSSLLSFNITKKKIIEQMDKIDDTKIKKKQMISRRRQLQDDLKKEDDKIKKTKEELKKIKVV